MQQFSSIPQSLRDPQPGSRRKGVRCAASDSAPRGPNWSSDRSSQGMVQRKILSSNRLKWTWFSVLLSNPLTKDDFPFHLDRTLVYVVVSLRNGAQKTRAKISSNQRCSPLALWAMADYCCRRSHDCRFFVLGSVLSSRMKKTWNQIQEGNYACHSFQRRPPY
jgi:hypothetical protein